MTKKNQPAALERVNTLLNIQDSVLASLGLKLKLQKKKETKWNFTGKICQLTCVNVNFYKSMPKINIYTKKDK